jgi:predicted small lipoprotein YifL
MNTHFRYTALVTLLATLAACGRAPVDQPPAATQAQSTPAPKPRSTCERVTAEQMSAILGAPVNAELTSGTECSYNPKSGAGMPMAQLTIDLGSAEAAMTATGMLGQMEPGMTNPYEGLGDQASAIGPAVWIRRGEDLIMITVIGVEDHDAAVKRVYELVNATF